mmetsp:Transcript_2783/g.3046  ORF Transcript_2783/g.3046 Transcript_2783/m.3046 type:complete len:110 (+) Transcript_2783:449-778(+)
MKRVIQFIIFQLFTLTMFWFYSTVITYQSRAFPHVPPRTIRFVSEGSIDMPLNNLNRGPNTKVLKDGVFFLVYASASASGREKYQHRCLLVVRLVFAAPAVVVVVNEIS